MFTKLILKIKSIINSDSSSSNSGIRDFGLTFSSKVFVIISSLGSQSILAWILGPEERGAYAVVLLFCMILSLVFIVGCDYAGIFFLASKKIDLSEVIISSIVFCFIGSIFAILVGIILFQFPFSFLEKASITDFYLSLILIPFYVLSHTIIMLISAKSSFFWFSLMNAFNGLLQIVFTAVFVYYFELGVSGALYALIATGIITVLSTLYLFYVNYGLKFKIPQFENLKKIFEYDLRHYVGKLSNQVNLEVGTIILAFFASKEEIGLFAVAATLTTRFNMIPDTLSVVLIPKVASDAAGRHSMIAGVAKLTGVICGFLLFLLFIGSDVVVRILFSPAFAGASDLIRILTIGVLIRCYSKILVIYLLGTNRPGIISWGVGIGTLINLSLLWYLLPILGISAAAISMSLSFIISSIIFIIVFKKLSKMDINEMFGFEYKDFEIIKSMFNKFLYNFSFK